MIMKIESVSIEYRDIVKDLRQLQKLFGVHIMNGTPNQIYKALLTPCQSKYPLLMQC